MRIRVYLHLFDYRLRDYVDGLLANYPVAVAPAMGHNFFFAYTVALTMKVPWQTAL
jgi:AGZA family xanthine/uracil permease-like MFS transporter